jgi:hypothetical protein
MPSKPIVPLPSTLLRASAFAWPLLSTIFRFSDSHALEKQHSRWAIQECPFRTWLGRMVFLVGTHVFPIQVFWLPNGTIHFRSKSNGADTEVRPPATLCLGPDHGGLWWNADWDWRPTFSPSSARTLSVPHPRETAANRVSNPSTRLGDLLGVRRRVLHAVARGGFSRSGRLTNPRRLGCVFWFNKAGAA